MSKVKKATFLTSMSKIGSDFVGFSLPEIVIAGRSNVGKSSFINALSNNSKLAKTSSTPGRTRLVNFFDIDNKFVLVDLPGYGFAKAGKAQVDTWDTMIGDYLNYSKNIKAVLLLVDIRREATHLDSIMMNYAYAKNIPVIVVATKADKIKRSQEQRCVQNVASSLKVGKENVFLCSAINKTGFDKIYDKIESLIAFGGENDEHLGD